MTLASTTNTCNSKMRWQQSINSSSKSIKLTKTKMKIRDRKDPTQFWNTAKTSKERLRPRAPAEISHLDNQVKS